MFFSIHFRVFKQALAVNIALTKSDDQTVCRSLARRLTRLLEGRVRKINLDPAPE
jgi:hypothetical protein